MPYAQLKPNGTFDTDLPSGLIQFDQNNYCTAEALIRDGKAEQFRVVELLETTAPAINPITESVMRDGAEKVNGKWQYKWRVDQLSVEQIETQRKASVPETVSPAQFREALIDTPYGDGVLFDAVEAIVATLERKKQLKWEFATEIRRDNPDVVAIAVALGLTEMQLDKVFIDGSKL